MTIGAIVTCRVVTDGAAPGGSERAKQRRALKRIRRTLTA
jgi:hypothetical protein